MPSTIEPRNSKTKKETTDPKVTSNNINVFYETLLKQNSSKTNVEKQEFPNDLNNKTLTNQQSDLYKNEA